MNKIRNEILMIFTEIKKTFSYNKPNQEITLSDFVLLSNIIKHGTYDVVSYNKVIKASTLADSLEMSKPALAKATRKLERIDYIKKVNLENDLRTRYIMLTPYGKAQMNKLEEKFFFIPDEIINRLGQEESLHLIKLLKQVNQIVLETRKKVGMDL